MRPWTIVLSGAIGGILALAAMAIAEVMNTAHHEIAPILLSQSPSLLVAAVAGYGLCTILTTTASLVADLLRLRHTLAQTAAEQVSVRREGSAAFVNGLRRIAPRLAAALVHSGTADGIIAFGARLTASETRGDIARLYYVSLARSHFLSALIVLAGMAALGLAPDRAWPPLAGGALPTGSIMIMIAGLMLLGILGRIAVDVTAEPLLEAISQLQTDPVEVELLRRAVELLELACNRTLAAATSPPLAHIPEQLIAASEEGRHALLDAFARLSAGTGALEGTLQKSVEALEEALRAAAAQHRPAESDRVAGAVGLQELQAAVEELTAVLQRLSTIPADAETTARAADRAPPRPASAPRLARELRQLLQEIEATR